MQEIARQIWTRLERGESPRALLEQLGDPTPERTAAALAPQALPEPLAARWETWMPALLASARPSVGVEALTRVVRARADAGAHGPEALAALARLLGSSNFLARLLQQRPAWTDALDAPPALPDGADWTAIREHKYRWLAHLASQELAGEPFPPTLGALSDLADRCLAAGLARAAHEETAPAPALLALGKLGGRELNFSSDVDLLFLCEDGGDVDAGSRVVQHLKREMERPAAEGFAYRVDLELRPQGHSGALVHGVQVALGYYEACGAEWERQAMIRLRAVAGPRDAAARFVRELQPFVYRRTLGPEVLGAVRAMKQRIENERRGAGRDLEMDLKEGPGGIRDVEFLVQSMQLFHGGHFPALRTGNVLEALEALARTGVLREATCAALADSYVWLRRAEQAIQLAEERQTQRLPRDPAAQLRVARRMGYADERGEEALTRFRDDWSRARDRVRAQFDALVLEASPALEALLHDVLGEGALRERAEETERLFREAPEAPAELAELPPAILRGVARAAASSADAARELARRPEVRRRLSEIDPSYFARRAPELAAGPPQLPDDLEHALDHLRLLRREETLLAACVDLGGAVPFEIASAYLSLLAEHLLDGALDLAVRGVRAVPPVAVLAMGKLGGREFTYQSDLDLVFLYEGGVESIDGASRVCQRLIAYLTTSTATGRVYEVDARLRPSGGQGTLVTTVGAFEQYQRREAQRWEHLALVRARAVAGAVDAVQRRLDALRDEIYAAPDSPWPEIAAMRRRVEAERGAERDGAITLKTGPGGLMDAEFLAQAAFLERGPAATPPEYPGIPELLRAAAPGAATERLLEAYALLRRVEARARWVTGRAVEILEPDTASGALIAELVAPGATPATLREAVEDARATLRAGFEAVCKADSIDGLEHAFSGR